MARRGLPLHEGAEPRVVPHVSPSGVSALLDAVTAGTVAEHPAVLGWLDGQRRELMGRCGVIDPGDMADAIAHGSYDQWPHALAGGIERPAVAALAEVVRVASLCGLGQAAPLSLLSALAEFPDQL